MFDSKHSTLDYMICVIFALLLSLKSFAGEVPCLYSMRLCEIFHLLVKPMTYDISHDKKQENTLRAKKLNIL